MSILGGVFLCLDSLGILSPMRTLAVAIWVVALTLLIYDQASAHTGTPKAAQVKIIRSNMYHQCGNGLFSVCSKPSRRARALYTVDPHTWMVRGRWDEARPLGWYACKARFLSGPHGIGWIPSTERCHHL